MVERQQPPQTRRMVSHCRPGRRWPLACMAVVPLIAAVSACGYTENVEDEASMLSDLQAWSAKHYPNAHFDADKSSCDLIADPSSSAQWEAAECTLALQTSGSARIEKYDVWAGSNGSAVLFHLDDPSFDPTSNRAWDQLAKSRKR